MKLTLKKRAADGKSKVKMLRKEGFIPGVVYGLNEDPVSVVTTPREIIDLFKNPMKQNVIFEADIEGKKESLITYKIDKDPITRQILHMDFLRVEKDKKIKVNVPLELTGSAPGQKRGGFLVVKTSTLRIFSVPVNIPTKIVIDLSELQIGDFIKVKDIDTKGHYDLITNLDDTIVRVAAPRKQISDAEDDALAQSEDSQEESGSDS